MTPTAAARASQSSAESLRDRLKDPSLLREQCYIDGAWVGAPARPVTNPVNGAELAKVPVATLGLVVGIFIRFAEAIKRLTLSESSELSSSSLPSGNCGNPSLRPETLKIGSTRS